MGIGSGSARRGAALWVLHTLPGLGRSSTKSPANFLCSASRSAPFQALTAISPPVPTPTLAVEMTGWRGVLHGGRQCQSRNLEAPGPTQLSSCGLGTSHAQEPSVGLASCGSHGEACTSDSCTQGRLSLALRALSNPSPGNTSPLMPCLHQLRPVQMPPPSGGCCSSPA